MYLSLPQETNGKHTVAGVGDHRWQSGEPRQCVQEHMWLHILGLHCTAQLWSQEVRWAHPVPLCLTLMSSCCRMAITWERSLCAKPVLE